MFVQSGLSLVVGLPLLVLVTSSDMDDGAEAGFWSLLLVGSLLLSVALLVCAVMVPRRRASVRITAILIESVNAASALAGEIMLIASCAEPAPAVAEAAPARRRPSTTPRSG